MPSKYSSVEHSMQGNKGWKTTMKRRKKRMKES
jgi:hypothetical protein